MPDKESLDIARECKDIIKNNSPKKSIDIISKIKLSNGEKIGKDNALKIYKIFSLDSVEYKDEHKFNYSKYKKGVDKNLSEAEKYVKEDKDNMKKHDSKKESKDVKKKIKV